MICNTVEESLEVLVGFRGDYKFQIESVDKTILYSIGRQVFRGKALTDRQLEVVKQKLENYSDQFKTNHVLMNLSDLRMPLREIDRSQYVKIVNDPREGNENTHIAVRFPFNKKTIILIEQIARKHSKSYYHEKGSHVHYFKLSESTLYDIVDAFINKSFTIDQDIIDCYKKIQHMKENFKDHLPGIYNFELKNVHEETAKYIINDLGHPNKNNIALYKDRSILYGLKYFDNILDDHIKNLNILSQKIAKRSSNIVYIDSKEWSMNSLFQSLWELQRLPLLVVLTPREAEDGLSTTYDHLRHLISNQDISVLFRLDGDANFNKIIREKSLNNPIANNTKVVYICSDKKPPKTLEKAKFEPKSVLYLKSFRSKVDSFAEEYDLVIHYDEVMTSMHTQRRHSHMRQIQKI